ncbi:MAG: hypothetical protein K0R38_7427 [Polyangiaceae bacterium]|jgi:light-regulated signal transduction histidine kinase (bacteriophytochrome)|nr:hypothetical protein [Polyangiaceae bacterium]
MTHQDGQLPPAWHGQAYSAKRHGVTITNCDSEPVQTPGCIQAHGVLLAVRRSDMTILQVSENAEAWIGKPPEALLGASVATVVGEEGRSALEATLQAGGADANPTYVFTLPGRDARAPMDVTVHTSAGVVVVELESYGLTEAPQGRDPYAQLRGAVARLQRTTTLNDFSQSACEELRALTGFDRVMVYRFHEDLHGEVVAEARLPTLEPFLGLHYPAEDIPAPARDIFRKLWIRPVPDVAGELVELVPLTNSDTGRGLDMTLCALRGPSIMYTEYLRNMGVRSALTLSLRRGDELWGLVSCHGYSAPLRLPFHVRAACELFAQVISLQHQAAEEREHLQYRLRLDRVHARLVERSAQHPGLTELNRGDPTLLDAVEGGGAAVYDEGQWRTVGAVPETEQLDALREWLDLLPEFESVFSTAQLPRRYPPAHEFKSVASGLLAVRFGRSYPGMLFWFRPELPRDIQWAGNPADKPTTTGPNGPRLTPRRSFELFLESVAGSSRPWTSVEVTAAQHLRHQLFALVLNQTGRIARLNDELRASNRELARSNQDLDAFAYVASHDLKEPLRGINKYAHQLLSDLSPDDSGRRSKAEGLVRLTLRMDALIDSLLHFSRVGRVSLETEPVDLGEVVKEALEMLDARRAVDVRIPRPLPVVQGDRPQLREVMANLLSNAMKYNDKPQPWVEIGYLKPEEEGHRGDVPSGSAGKTLFFVRDNGIGISAAHQPVVFELFRRLHGRDAYGGGVGAGLTIVRRLLERHGGAGWLSSELGAGTTFFFSLGGVQ